MSLCIKMPRTFDIVEGDTMIETIKSDKYIIIAIPIEDAIIKATGEPKTL